MKKTLALILSLLVSLSAVSGFADGLTSGAMESALLNVKQRVDIPPKLTEFTSSVREQKGDNYYSFNWEDADMTSNLSVRCDSKGRISEYYLYDSKLESESVFSDITKKQVMEYADNFMRKLAPEAFYASDDCLIMDKNSISANGRQTYSIYFDRYKNGVKVKDNRSNISVYIVDNNMYVRNVSINFDYDAQFEAAETVISGAEDKYFEKFPIELIYRDEYDYSVLTNGEPEKEIIMLYRIKDNEAGYISAGTGEIIKEESVYFGTSNKNESMSDSAMGGGSGSPALTEKEIAELETIEGLISKEEILNILKKLPLIDYDASLQINSFRIFSDKNGDYFINISSSNNNENNRRSFSAKINAKDGKIMRINNHQSYDGKNTANASEKNQAEKNIRDFILAVCPDEFSQCQINKTEWYDNNLTESYDRYVNDIRYINNGVYISYDAHLERIISYELIYDKNTAFPPSDKAIDRAAARNALLNNSPLEQIYVKSGEEYKLCYGLTKPDIEIEAVSGERIVNSYEKENNQYEYTDIENHWAKEAIEKLSFIDIGFDGEEFSPDKEITQRDLLSLFGAGIYYNSYLDYNDDELYRRLLNNKILTAEEKAPYNKVTREDAFVYMIRMAELERVAKAENIYKVEYADSYTLSQGKLGYAAILTGLDVLSGYGGYIRANENITRAEAAVMLYKYMLGK